jgi:hypothetical protein
MSFLRRVRAYFFPCAIGSGLPAMLFENDFRRLWRPGAGFDVFFLGEGE